MAKVFVSHQRKDSTQATRIADRLHQNGLNTYLDVVDDALTHDGKELSDLIRKRMDSCTHLIAVVSNATTASWWVPWQIGIASDREFMIATYALDSTALPSFLTKWPYLRSLADIDKYARQSSSTSGKLYLTEAARVGEFHKSLKRSLGQ